MTPCARGCTEPGRHFADCSVYDGIDHVNPCTGCMPTEALAGMVVCDRCRRRFRWMLHEVSDLVGRMRSVADPTSATCYEDLVQRGGGSGRGEVPAPLPSDLADASTAVQMGLWRLAGAQGHRPRSDSEGAAEDAKVHAKVILRALESWHLADEFRMSTLHDVLWTRHVADEAGLRRGWSAADALAQWGSERREFLELALEPSRALRPEPVRLLAADGRELSVPIAEWGNGGDGLLTRQQAAQEAGSDRTLRRWVAKGELRPETYAVIDGARRPMFRRSTVHAVRDRIGAKRGAGQRDEGGRFAGSAAP